MAATTLVELPAARLRARDILLTYGEHATIVRPPVISLDGAMTNVLVASPSGDEQVQLVRLPVGLRVQVQRPVADPEHGFVRGTKVARSSGARIAVLDLHHPDSEIPAAAGESFATLCTTHHTLKTHAGISTAHAQSSHPEQWCTPCADATKQRAHERVYGTAPSDAGAGEATA